MLGIQANENHDEQRRTSRAQSKRKIYQITWVTRDLEKSMRAWVENLKIGPWTVLTFTDQSLKYLEVDDKPVTAPFKFLIGISWIGGERTLSRYKKKPNRRLTQIYA
ncbi:MAG: hypothetical protein WBZ19_21735 [Chthoniobacterales bacterium]